MSLVEAATQRQRACDLGLQFQLLLGRRRVQRGAKALFAGGRVAIVPERVDVHGMYLPGQRGAQQQQRILGQEARHGRRGVRSSSACSSAGATILPCPRRRAAGLRTSTWMPSMRPSNCCAIPSCSASRWSSAAGGATSRAAGRWHAPLRPAARLHRPRCGHHRHLRGARPGRVLGDGPDEGRAACARCGAAAGGLRRVPALFQAVQGRGGRSHAADRGPRRRRDLHRPEPGAGRARRRWRTTRWAACARWRRRSATASSAPPA